MIAFLSTILSATGFAKQAPRLLVFSKTTGFRHASIADGKIALLKIGKELGFDVDTTEDASWFNEEKLKQYSAIIFLSTTGDVLNAAQEAQFERYIQAGGGFVGIHAASDTEFDWPWYGKLVGGYFISHPKTQSATLQVIDNKHLSTSHLPKEWKRTDEWYNFKNLNRDVNVLIKLDEKSYTGGANGDDHPIAWYHEYDGGRIFYTGLGHTPESWTEENFLKHLLGGIQYAIGKNKKLDYRKATTKELPGTE
jgi:type 1 glutamine amidotransferase